jgi:gamma-aminobutyric acid type B receptor
VEPAELSPATQLALTFLVGCCFVVSCVFGGLLYKYRSHRVIHAASPVFCAIFVLGSFLLFGSALTMIQTQSQSLCMLQSWLFNIGFTLSYGSLFTKTWRLHKIFNVQSQSYYFI